MMNKPNKTLINNRKKINKVDRMMKRLFLKRMAYAKQIGEYKQNNHLPIVDLKREQAIKDQLSKDITDITLKNLYLNYLNNLISLSKDYQKLDNNIVYEPFTNFIKYLDNNKYYLIIDEKVYNFYQDQIKSVLNNNNYYILKSGEESKSFESYTNIIHALIQNHYTKHDYIIGIGGGVVTDLSGMLAGTYKRGMNLILVPTTVLGMVDASIGYKNGINFENTKNQIGMIYEPNKIIIDFNFLKTLDERLISEGFAEIIKIFLCLSEADFLQLENNSLSIEDAIKKAISLKQQIVLMDKEDKDLRNVLNFGHTIGHAVEACCKGKYYHGECVAIGMLYFAGESIKSRVQKILLKYHLPIKCDYTFDEIYPYLVNDKKANHQQFKVVRVNKIGSFEFVYYTLDELKQIYINYINN